MKNMPPIIRRFIYAIFSVSIWFASLIFFALILNIIPGATYINSEDGAKTLTDFGAIIFFLAPIIVTILCMIKITGKVQIKNGKIRISKSEKTKTKGNKFVSNEKTNQLKIPMSKKKQIEMAEDIIASAQVNASLANTATHVGTFLEYYDSAISDLEKLSQLEEKVSFKNESPSYACFRLKDEFQWHLCDAIERSKNSSLDEIKGKYRNSKEYKERRANWFISEIEDSKNRYSKSTLEFADNAIAEVKKAAGLSLVQDPSPYGSDNQDDKATSFCVPEIELINIDLMEGHEFEHWCAELLRKNGFLNVTVTPGSGDQGVDIVAEKESVHYAVQCKCYSSDIGNKPVQEVFAGKEMYGCQVGAVMTNRHFTSGAKQLAEKTRVLLWDRDKLIEMIQKPVETM